MKKIKLYDQVTVYPNAIKNVEKHIEMLKDSEYKIGGKYNFNAWQDWYGIGTMMNIGMLNKDEDLKNKYLDNLHAQNQIDFMKDARDAFYSTTEDYFSEYNIELPNWDPKPNWARSGLSVCRYNITKNPQHLALAYHTDTHEFDLESPGQKFGITCTMYLNDNYEGGEVSFLNEADGEVVTWKPTAGDVIVFPSHSPFFHGVHPVFSGSRYLIRTWWFFDYAGSKNWHENNKKYGEEVWIEMEKKRKREEFESGNWHRHVIFDGEDQSGLGHKSVPFYVKRKREVGIRGN